MGTSDATILNRLTYITHYFHSDIIFYYYYYYYYMLRPA